MRFSCARARREAALAVGGDASPAEVQSLEAHVATCRPCLEAWHELARAHAAIDDLAVRLGYVAGARSLTPPPVPASRPRRRRVALWLLAVVLAGLAGLAVHGFHAAPARRAPAPVAPTTAEPGRGFELRRLTLRAPGHVDVTVLGHLAPPPIRGRPVTSGATPRSRPRLSHTGELVAPALSLVRIAPTLWVYEATTP